jgi:hypothetical protein
MKKYQLTLFMILLIGFVTTTAPAAKDNLMSIQIKEGHLRDTPSFLGKILAALEYGDRVEVLERKDLWVRIQAVEKYKTGWIHDSALTMKKIILKPGKADVEQAATSDELALAGKGFNEQVEKEFNAKNPQLDYTWIDDMEQIVISQEQIMQFLKEGELTR